MSGQRTGNVPTLVGWLVVALLGAGVFLLLRNSFAFLPLSAACFGLAAALFLLLLLTGSDSGTDADSSRVRKIVPGPEVLPPMTRPEVAPTRVVSSAARSTGEPASETSKAAPARDEGPTRLTVPRDGKADDLKVIEGIGPALEQILHLQGIFHIDQIAGWTEADIAAVDARMAKFKGRIARDRWVAQARIIVTEGLEAFKERAKTNNY